MSVYSKRLAGPVVNSALNLWAVIYTVPANTVAVVRCVTIANGGADASKAWLAINGTAAANRVFIRDVPTVTGTVDNLRMVLRAGETLHYRATVTALQGTCIQVSGYELEA